MDIARFFIALPIPAKTRMLVAQALARQERTIVHTSVPEESWHITLVFLGAVEDWQRTLAKISKPLPSHFVPTVTITHLGQGKNRKQLWAYVQATNVLLRARTVLAQRAGRNEDRPFIPHVRVAELDGQSVTIGVADTRILTSFRVREACVYRSDLLPDGAMYTKVGVIPFT